MRHLKIIIVPAILLSLTAISAAADSIRSVQLSDGWRGLARQVDPFDTSKIKLFQISNGNFRFRCYELNMQVNSSGSFYGFSGLADIRYIVDDQEPVERPGSYSTYLGGSDMITDSRYYSFELTRDDAEAMKSGAVMKVAGISSGMGWSTHELSLIGFASAYGQMCE